jgi:hypothetical protein
MLGLPRRAMLGCCAISIKTYQKSSSQPCSQSRLHRPIISGFVTLCALALLQIGDRPAEAVFGRRFQVARAFIRSTAAVPHRREPRHRVCVADPCQLRASPARACFLSSSLLFCQNRFAQTSRFQAFKRSDFPDTALPAQLFRMRSTSISETDAVLPEGSPDAPHRTT